MRRKFVGLFLSAALLAPVHEVWAGDYDVEEWIGRVKPYTSGASSPTPDARAKLLTELSVATEDRSSIDRIRKADSVAAVIGSSLILGNTDDPIARKAASLVIINLVDNTTICLVTDHLRRNNGLNASFQLNLLQAIRLVGSYAYRENVTDVVGTIDDVERRLPTDADQGRRLVASIRETLAKNTENGTSAIPAALNDARTRRCPGTSSK